MTQPFQTDTDEPRLGVDYALKATLFGSPLLLSDASIGCSGLWLWSPQRPCEGTIICVQLIHSRNYAATTARVVEHDRDCFFARYLQPEPLFNRMVSTLLAPAPIAAPRDNVVVVDFAARRAV